MNDPRSNRLRRLLQDDEPEQNRSAIPAASPPPPAPPPPTAPPVEEQLDSALEQLFVEPRSIEETRVPQSFLSDLALKTLYFGGAMPGGRVAQAMRLHFSSIVDPILRELKAQHLVEVTGGSSINQASYQYSITNKGGERARELLERNRYVGPCPVTLRHYIEAVKLQGQRRSTVKEEDVRKAMKGLILSDSIIEAIGPAVNSYESVFVYGPPGNGKSSIAKAIGLGLLPGNVMVPHAIFEDGQVIKVFDPESHRSIGTEEEQLATSDNLDKRWVRCAPPIVITGGELTLSDLDLSWSDTNRFYEAPLQLKANGGIFVIDDFGRQRMAPQDLLNRWIVPLEENIDYLTFHTGKKFPIPFETLLVFSTNLEPQSLVDEAFLRRISHKMKIDNPSEAHFRVIFRAVSEARGIEFDENVLNYLLHKYYKTTDRPLRACHPRDLLKQVANYATYRGEPLAMTNDLIDRAAKSYFELL